MTPTYEITLWCEGCSTWVRVTARKVTTARRLARHDGWSSYRIAERWIDKCGICTRDGVPSQFGGES